jgi:hypothetical protein
MSMSAGGLRSPPEGLELGDGIMRLMVFDGLQPHQAEATGMATG